MQKVLAKHRQRPSQEMGSHTQPDYCPTLGSEAAVLTISLLHQNQGIIKLD